MSSYHHRTWWLITGRRDTMSGRSLLQVCPTGGPTWRAWSLHFFLLSFSLFLPTLYCPFIFPTLLLLHIAAIFSFIFPIVIVLVNPPPFPLSPFASLPLLSLCSFFLVSIDLIRKV
ncbi:hypothetical protein F383_17259 [Gossypium arboreum]|uniref:Transmembrane protein n=2 Tax=Gossypium arboreum TaxID=29729 RepID=A0A0B0NPN7_GOSAR|nr:hypothetical protein F383_17259 [Gossypium arboreum]